MASMKDFFARFKKKEPQVEDKSIKTVEDLKKAIWTFSMYSDDSNCITFLEQLDRLSPNTPLTIDLINSFELVVKNFLNNKIEIGRGYGADTRFTKACYYFSSYATARKEDDGSYSISPVITFDEVSRFIVNKLLENPSADIVSMLETSNKQSYQSLNISKINTYYGKLDYIVKRTEAIIDAITMFREYPLAPDEFQFVEIKYVEANELADIIKTTDEKTMTSDIYFNRVHKSFQALVEIEDELSFISNRIWQEYFKLRGAKLVHALTGAKVQSDEMDKICTTLYLDDLATIPYGHTGYQYDFDIQNVLCICEEDAGSWRIPKSRFVGEDGDGISHSWQYSEKCPFFYEFGYHSKLLPPQYIEAKARDQNYGSKFLYYTEILLSNTKHKIPPVKAFYTDYATPEEIEEISTLAQLQGIPVEYIDTKSIAEAMNLHAKMG